MSPWHAWAEVSFDALRHNLKLARTRSKDKEIVAVVKADAYGHGALEVSRCLGRCGVRHFAVALAAEAASLRAGGVKSRIYLVTPVLPEEADEVFRLDLVPLVCSEEDVAFLSRAARRRKKKLTVNLKIDTGLNRLGFSPAALPQWGARLREAERTGLLKVEGILTHLAVADSDRSFTALQIARFRRSVQELKTLGLSPRNLHLENSAAVLYYDRREFNMIRPGLMLYGLDPAPGFKSVPGLRPVLSLYSRVLQVRQLERGESVSYGRLFVAKRKMRLAVLAIGYADGYPRALSNRGEVIIKGRRCRQLGTVCMDMIMVDVSGVPGVRPGDKAVIIGGRGKGRISAAELAAKSGTIAYEIACGISKRVPRVYVK